MKKGILTGGAIVLIAMGASAADDATANSNRGGVSYDTDSAPLYHANELSLDLFGSDSLGRYTVEHISGDRIRHDSRLGVGLGVNYFFTKYVGIGGDALTENSDNHFIDDVSGSLILRLPFESLGLAPYVFGGGGHEFDPIIATFLHAGAGLEWRFVRHVGVFVDARYVWSDNARDYTVTKAGVRVSF